MPGIKQPLQDVMSRLTTLQVQNQDYQFVSLYTRIFNNQIKRQREGKEYAIPLPACFVEVIAPDTFDRIGNGFSESDLVFRLHLVHWFTDAQDGTFEQDLIIFDLRDSVIALMSNFRPTACNELFLISESQDYDHDDVYVYLLEFKCGFIDSKGSPYDTGRTDIYIDKAPPTDLNLTVVYEKN